MDRGRGSARMARLSRLAVERSRAACARARLRDQSVHESLRGGSGAEDRQVEVPRDAADYRGRPLPRNPAALAFLGRFRPGLFSVRSLAETVKRRRTPTVSLARPLRADLAAVFLVFAE